jgi:hypothetical protein
MASDYRRDFDEIDASHYLVFHKILEVAVRVFAVDSEVVEMMPKRKAAGRFFHSLQLCIVLR